MLRRDAWWALGLGAAALTVGAAYTSGGGLRRFGGWAPYEAPEWLLAPTAIAGLLAAAAYGIWASPAETTARRLRTGAAWTSLWGACLAMSPTAVWVRFYAATQRLVLPDAREVSRGIDVMQGDERQDFSLRYETDLSLDEAEKVLVERLKDDGWHVKRWGYGVAGYAAEGMLGGTVRRGDGLLRYGARKDAGDMLKIYIHDAGAVRRIHLDPGLAPATRDRLRREMPALKAKFAIPPATLDVPWARGRF